MKEPWSRVVSLTESWQAKWPFAHRLRIELFYAEQYSPAKRRSAALQHLLSGLKLWLHCARDKGLSSSVPSFDIGICLAPNKAYLDTLLPIYHALIAQGKSVRFLCKQRDVQPLIAQGISAESLLAFESLHGQRGLGLSGLFRSFRVAVFSAPRGTSLFHKFLAFRYAVQEQAFTASIPHLTKALYITATEHWYWESWVVTNLPTTLWVQHGLISYYHAPVYGTRAAVWGTADADFLQRQGVRPEVLVPTGSTKLDAIAAQLDTVRQANMSKTGAPPQRLLIISQPFKLGQVKLWEPYCDMIREGMAIAKELNLEVALQLHPLDKREFYSEFTDLRIITNTPLAETLSHFDAMLTADSTSVYESNLVGLYPIQWIAEEHKDDFVDFGHLGLVEKVSNAEQLRRSLYMSRIHTTPISHRAIAYPGRSLEFILDLIAQHGS